MKIVQAATLLPLLVALTSCIQEAQVAVIKQGQVVRFVVSRLGRDAPCVDSVYVSRPNDDIKTTPALWEIATADMKNCRSTFVYGEVPPGWSQARPAPRLQPGTEYAVDITGPGVLGGTPFRMRDGDGVLSDPG